MEKKSQEDRGNAIYSKDLLTLKNCKEMILQIGNKKGNENSWGFLVHPVIRL